MRILHVSTRLILGGSQENTVLSCEGQARLGHEVHLAFGPIYGPEGSLLERVDSFHTPDAQRISTHVVANLVREVNPLRDLRARRELVELIGRIRPDIVHTHSSKAGILGRAAAWKSLAHGIRCGIVHTIHGPPFMPIEGGFFARVRTRLLNRVYTLAERHAAKRCHRIVSVADAMTREFLSRGIGMPEQYVTVRSGMETSPYLVPARGQGRADIRAALGLDENDFVVGTVARLAQHKGHDDLLRALKHDLHANPAWKLLWVGDGWLREQLLHRARTELGLRVAELDHAGQTRDAGAQIIVTGLVPPDQVPGLVRAMDVLAHPSTREGLPRTVPQALLAGVCPVAYDVDGTGEVCIEMRTGRLVRAGDITGLGEAIRWCASNPREREKLARHGRELCRLAFSDATMVDALEKVYTQAMAMARA